MKVTIGGKELNYEMNGTLGPALVVEQITGEEFCPWGQYDHKGKLIKQPNALHSVYLCLVILQFSNPSQKEELTIDWLLSNLTGPVNTQLLEYTVKRWKELEEWKGLDEDKQKTDKDTPKNA